jgi:hypothetical protein
MNHDQNGLIPKNKVGLTLGNQYKTYRRKINYKGISLEIEKSLDIIQYLFIF